jgi:hypothetical protein
MAYIGKPTYAVSVGGTGLSSTTINQILYSSSNNVISGLTTANSGVVDTTSVGVPQVDTTNFAVLSTGVQVKGNNTNTAPPAGFLGEAIRNYQSTAVSLTSGTTASVTSISITAGIWDVSALVQYTVDATTSMTKAQVSINTTQSVINANFGDQTSSFQTAASVGMTPFLANPSFRVLLSGTTTYWLNANAIFTVSTCGVSGRISATRVG